ncbi:DNA gyrase/topoisomerase IV subunit A [Chamaesiphon minutus]|uniref:DNA topoisomerase (ATP-hydrolyzing) n=1 Tax=Chamaesiphon minutus (strain ATCC 27169 / PCC 6605) TaxID=1173020 RepID=K9UB50_CHAP6|nr:DNA topoisomerase (ATP-hydrolyzing) [Chamaesiphon minutus]AFY91449.1 type IIA topoisomerase (DNA gyrase/topo II, topoisomerase IV), A subunit [Chamaesiphon minutus PCC 6605]
MVKQLDLLGTEKIIPIDLPSEMQRSYLEYAMSVIVGRALPDVRDGLKPVHRRIVYAMHELGLTPDRPYRKCARVVGDVLGKYHPHGDQSVYDALVRLVQDFSTRYPLLAGHGNFGSVDNDPPAAMRYTETRLAPLSHEALLGEIGTATVDFIGNFDNSQQEPTVLPAQVPILLVNGCSGIAVGMATNIPPHNIGEAIDGAIALIDKPDLPDAKLWELIPGPDFPTGGEIMGIEGIHDAYRTGRGIITVRGVSHVEIASDRAKLTKSKKRRDSLIVTELPFQVNKAAWIEKVAELVNAGKIDGIADLRDESDREGMRVVIEIKRDSEPRNVLEQLYRQTALQSNFGAIMLAIVEGQPRQLTLRQLLEEFLKFREVTLTRQYGNELEQAQKRVHLVSGLLTALDNLDAVINILRNAPDGTTAKAIFQTDLNLSETQADAILAMPLRRLTGLEKKNLQTEFQEVNTKINTLNTLLQDRNELLKSLKKDLRSLKRKFADARRTKITKIEPPVPQAKADRAASTRTKNASAETPKEARTRTLPPSQLQIIETEPGQPVTVEITHQGYIRRLSKTGSKLNLQTNDFVTKTYQTNTEAELILVTSDGKAYPLRIRDIPPTLGNDRGTLLTSLIPALAESPDERVLFSLPTPDEAPDDMQQLLLLTAQGKIKRILIQELSGLTNRGTTLIKLREDDKLHTITPLTSQREIVIATSGARILRLALASEQIPLMGRVSQGIQALKVGNREQIVGCIPVNSTDEIVLISRQGYAKRIPIAAIRIVQTGNMGTHAMQFAIKTDNLLYINVPAETLDLVTTTHRHELVAIDRVQTYGKDGTGDKLVELAPNEEIMFVN